MLTAPPRRKKTTKKKDTKISNFIIQTYKVGTSFEEICRLAEETTKLPLIIKFDNGQLFLKFDKTLAQLKSSNFNYAIDLLFKSYSVFSLPYPKEAIEIYNFLEIISDISSSIKPRLIELENNIQCI